MPSNFLNLDTRFPTFTGGESTEQKVAVIQNYLFMLLEQLRYSLRNLDAGNFNETGLKEITDPIYIRLEGEIGELVEISVTRSGIMTRMRTAEGEISELQQTAQSITTRVASVEETTEGLTSDVSSLEQTAESIATRVESVEETAEGLAADVSSLEQTAESITSRVSSVEETTGGLEVDVSELQQTADSLTFTIVQNGNAIEYRLGANGATISQSTSLELYSLDGLNPPVGKTAQGVIVNANGQNVLEHGWYNSWNSAWSNLAVYCCSSYNSGTSWGSVLLRQGVKGEKGDKGDKGDDGDDGTPGVDGLTVLLNNNPHTFAGTTAAAVADSTTVGVIAFIGSTRQAATIGTITGQPTGMTTSVTNNGTSSAGFTVNVTTSLTQQSGTLTVPVTVGSTTVNLLWSWSVAYKGEQGQRGQQGEQGERGPAGSDANVTFTNVNNALAGLFALVAGGAKVEITGGGVYAPVLRGGEIYGSKIYAGSGNGYAQMAENGLDVKDPDGYSKLGTGYTAITSGGSTTYYPFLKLGVGSSDASSNAGLVYKLGGGIWIGDSSIVAAGGQYPGGGNSVANISSSYPYATGIFIDINNDLIYKYINGVPTEMTTAVFA